MKAQNVSFDEVYDKFAFRIVSNHLTMKNFSLGKYSIVTDHYRPVQVDCDWISSPNLLDMKPCILPLWDPKVDG
jgi:GTP pyrophosphokinase